MKSSEISTATAHSYVSASSLFYSYAYISLMHIHLNTHITNSVLRF